MNLQIWVKVPNEIADDPNMLAVLDIAAQNMAAELGRTALPREVGPSDTPNNKVVCWALEGAK